MFKSTKSPNLGPSKPGLWADGAQFAPLSMNRLGRASTILARKTASSLWMASSTKFSDGAMALDDGFGAVFVAKLGSAAKVFPSRGFMVFVMTGLSRLQASAAQHVDYHSEPIEPLEISDLHSFLQSRRAKAAAAESERARKDSLGQIARRRAVAVSRRPKSEGEPSLEVISDSSLRFGGAVDVPTEPPLPAPTVLVEARPSVGMEELLAIRMALASAPEPPAAAVAVDPPIPPKELARLFATSQTPEPAEIEMEKAPVVQSDPAKPVGLSKWIARLVGGMFRSLGRLMQKAALGLFGLIWRLIGPKLASLKARLLGWGLVVLCLPFGAGKAIWSHAQGTDLRDFD